jgi:hypothetical protein
LPEVRVELDDRADGELKEGEDPLKGFEICDTNSLLRLRWSLDGTANVKTDDIKIQRCLDDLKDYRRQAKHLFSSFCGSYVDENLLKQVADLARKVWQTLSGINDSSPLYLPPIHEDKGSDLGGAIDDVIFGMIIREVGLISNSNDNYGHALLSGVKGVGKSTLLKAFAFAVAILFERMTPIYWDYSPARGKLYPDLTALSDLLDEFLLSIQSKQVAGRFGRSRRPKEHRLCLTEYCYVLSGQFNLLPCFLIDEFQLVYSRDANMEARLAIIYQLRALDSLGASYSVLAASTADVRGYLFRNHHIGYGGRTNYDQ